MGGNNTATKDDTPIAAPMAPMRQKLSLMSELTLAPRMSKSDGSAGFEFRLGESGNYLLPDFSKMTATGVL